MALYTLSFSTQAKKVKYFPKRSCIYFSGAQIDAMSTTVEIEAAEKKRVGLHKMAESLYDSSLIQELRRDRERLDWIQANWSLCKFIGDGDWPKDNLRMEIDRAISENEASA